MPPNPGAIVTVAAFVEQHNAPMAKRVLSRLHFHSHVRLLLLLVVMVIICGLLGKLNRDLEYPFTEPPVNRRASPRWREPGPYV